MKSLKEVRPARIEWAFFVTVTFYTSERSFRFVPAILLQCATIATNLFLFFRVSDSNRFNKTRIKHSHKSGVNIKPSWLPSTCACGPLKQHQYLVQRLTSHHLLYPDPCSLAINHSRKSSRRLLPKVNYHPFVLDTFMLKKEHLRQPLNEFTT